jgi:CRISPR/Cas system-associated protein endoribonuclease Cas2
MTLVAYDLTISRVVSVLPESTTIISLQISEKDFNVNAIVVSELNVVVTPVIIGNFGKGFK